MTAGKSTYAALRKKFAQTGNGLTESGQQTGLVAIFFRGAISLITGHLPGFGIPKTPVQQLNTFRATIDKTWPHSGRTVGDRDKGLLIDIYRDEGKNLTALVVCVIDDAHDAKFRDCDEVRIFDHAQGRKFGLTLRSDGLLYPETGVPTDKEWDDIARYRQAALRRDIHQSLVWI